MAGGPPPAYSARPPAPGAARPNPPPRPPARGRGRQKKGPRALGRSRGGRTGKPHLRGDGAGNVLHWLPTPGQAGDCPQAARLLAPHLAPAGEGVAGTADDRDALRGFLAAAGARAVIPPAPRRRRVPHFDPCAYAKRHHLEPTANKANKWKQHRRLATRDDKVDTSFQAFVCARIITPYLN